MILFLLLAPLLAQQADDSYESLAEDAEGRALLARDHPQKDYEVLAEAGCAAVFGPGTVVPEAALELLDLLEKQGKRPWPSD